jgi:BirA family biotin operon repressor/biotin-[acetyl-CoA-carboxylase] ligase
MKSSGIDLPSGYRLVFLDTVDSTNAEAIRRAGQGAAGGLWVWAASQKSGKGRAGRSWTSPPGNLYASLLIRPRVPVKTALQLSLLAGIAAHDAIASLGSGVGQSLDIRLKWPNDILIGGAKLGGILLESTSGSHKDIPAIIIGTGINLANAPADLSRPVTTLKAAGVTASPRQAFAALSWTTAEWLARWRDGHAFDAIRAAWLERAQPVGGPISVKIGHDLLSGTFLGIDEAGALRLSLASGEERRITAGDVAIGAGI